MNGLSVVGVRISSSLLASVMLSLLGFTMAACEGPAPTREQIVAKYPTVEVGSLRAENKQVLCPFVRMLERSGIFDSEVATKPTKTVSVKSLVTAAQDFGCAPLECSSVANVASVGQGSPGVDIERLHEAGPLSHECGLTFGFGEIVVSDVVRQATLDRLAQLADANGNLVYNDLKTVKLEICTAQGVNITLAGETEVKLIFAYLGGVENGNIPLSDVERLLHATMPAYKTKAWINGLLLGQVK